MKSIFFLLFILIFSSGVPAQVINVPGNAQKHFQERYQQSTDVKWQNNVANYSVSFKNLGASCKAHYNIDGTWDYTEKFIKKDESPEKVKEAFSKSIYRDNKLKSVVYVENADKQVLYRYEVKKGVTREYVFFDPEGTLIKTNSTL